ncbi:hypothetical protein M0Q50_10675 [bacterium]|jgi:hypothetical protein|nr:hypothetical protein [bacterium]
MILTNVGNNCQNYDTIFVYDYVCIGSLVCRTECKYYIDHKMSYLFQILSVKCGYKNELRKKKLDSL